MGKKFIIGLFIVAVSSFAFTANAQTDSSKKTAIYRVGIFAPLYLDSVFSNGSFRYKEGFPKFIVPAVEFVQGAEIAFDSMKLGNENVEAFIYDTRAYSKNIAYLIKNKQLDNLDLIIGAVKDADYKYLADFALAKKIPFISATHPNDGGLTGNPYTVIMNSTLKAHCEAIYSYLLQTHGTDNIYFCRKAGAQEDKIAMYFKMLNEQDGKALLNIQTINLDSSVTADFFRAKLDSNRQSVIIGASLDETFAKGLALTCAGLHKTYPLTLIGMPNWDGFASLYKKDDFEDLPIHFTSPYYNSKWDSYSKQLIAAYSKKFKNKPTDMAFKGFEMAYMFTKLLIKYPNDFISHINDKSVKVFCDYNIKPVLLKKENATADYFENKHLYFVRLMNGVKSKAW
jgi:Periplasmic binding protein